MGHETLIKVVVHGPASVIGPATSLRRKRLPATATLGEEQKYLKSAAPPGNPLAGCPGRLPTCQLPLKLPRGSRGRHCRRRPVRPVRVLVPGRGGPSCAATQGGWEVDGAVNLACTMG